MFTRANINFSLEVGGVNVAEQQTDQKRSKLLSNNNQAAFAKLPSNNNSARMNENSRGWLLKNKACRKQPDSGERLFDISRELSATEAERVGSSTTHVHKHSQFRSLNVIVASLPSYMKQEGPE